MCGRLWWWWLQVQVLSEGLMLYFGPSSGVLDWFSVHLGHPYQPAEHGSVPDWLMDLVNISFTAREGGDEEDEEVCRMCA